MSAQPLNTSISVFRTIRTQRDIRRSDSVAAIIKKLRPLLAVKPGEEIGVGVLTRDTATKDFSPYMGQASSGATRGFPIVIGLLPVATFAQAQALGRNTDGKDNSLSTLADFAFQIGTDKFIAGRAGIVATLASSDLFGLADAIN